MLIEAGDVHRLTVEQLVELPHPQLADIPGQFILTANKPGYRQHGREPVGQVASERSMTDG